jgi:hypothetical protein
MALSGQPKCKEHTVGTHAELFARKSEADKGQLVAGEGPLGLEELDGLLARLQVT